MLGVHSLSVHVSSLLSRIVCYGGDLATRISALSHRNKTKHHFCLRPGAGSYISVRFTSFFTKSFVGPSTNVNVAYPLCFEYEYRYRL